MCEKALVRISEVLTGKGESGTTWGEGKGVVPAAGSQTEEHSAGFVGDATEGTATINIQILVKGASDDDGAVGRCRGDDTSGAWVEADAQDGSLVQGLAERRLFCL